jgi:hypothetical protein
LSVGSSVGALEGTGKQKKMPESQKKKRRKEAGGRVLKDFPRETEKIPA